jgi:hypothetical protein
MGSLYDKYSSVKKKAQEAIDEAVTDLVPGADELKKVKKKADEVLDEVIVKPSKKKVPPPAVKDSLFDKYAKRCR